VELGKFRQGGALMKRWRCPLVLVGLVFWASCARAQEPFVTQGPVIDPQVQIISSTVTPVTEDDGTVILSSEEVPASEIQPQGWHPIHDTLQFFGLAGHSQQPYGTPGQVFYPHTQTAPPAVTPPTVVGPVPYTPPPYPPLDWDPVQPRPVRNILQRFGVGCWSHHTLPTCGSLRAHLTFVFGSCRAYFGESCAHGPTPVPIVGAEERPPSTAPWGPLPTVHP
jgi:hypothetical protein